MERDGSLRQQHSAQEEYTLEALMREYGDEVLRLACLYVKDIHTAEDMFQETFLKVNQKLGTFEERSHIKTWLLSIAMNTCRDYLKSAYHNKVVPMYDFAEERLSTGEEFEQVEKEERADTVREAVMSLPEHYRAVVICVYFRQLSMEETARELGLSTGTVKSRLSRAKEKLRAVLEGRLSDE
ncbi:MAG: sigma-70 family RNA polymerase sigma factor [Lachnospiraceae bacterium]|nr:sigma-70 family RNA polymerase sigma factor [Lachnospiraceae bacterium]